MSKLKISNYSISPYPIVILAFLMTVFVLTGCGKSGTSANTDSAVSHQIETASSHSSAVIATPIESSDTKKDDGVITFDDFKGCWATFDSKENEPFQSDIGKYTVAITNDTFIPGEWGTTLGGSVILDYTIEGTTLTLELYTPESNLENTAETYLLTLELVVKDGLFVLKSANGSVIFYPVTSQEFLDAGWKIPSDSL